MVTTALTKLSQDYLAAFNAHDLEKFLTFYTDDCIVEDAGLGIIFRGLQELRKSYLDFFKAFPDIKMEFKNDFQSGDWAATEWTMNGTQKGNMAPVGNLPAVPATNKKINFKGATISHRRGSKISRETDYFNGATMMQQLGLIPATPLKK